VPKTLWLVFSRFPLELDTQGGNQSFDLLNLCNSLIVRTLWIIQAVRMGQVLHLEGLERQLSKGTDSDVGTGFPQLI